MPMVVESLFPNSRSALLIEAILDKLAQEMSIKYMYKQNILLYFILSFILNVYTLWHQYQSLFIHFFPTTPTVMSPTCSVTASLSFPSLLTLLTA